LDVLATLGLLVSLFLLSRHFWTPSTHNAFYCFTSPYVPHFATAGLNVLICPPQNQFFSYFHWLFTRSGFLFLLHPFFVFFSPLSPFFFPLEVLVPFCVQTHHAGCGPFDFFTLSRVWLFFCLTGLPFFFSPVRSPFLGLFFCNSFSVCFQHPSSFFCFSL